MTNEEDINSLKTRVYLLENSVYSQSYEAEIRDLKNLINQMEEKIINRLANDVVNEVEVMIKEYFDNLSLEDFYKLLYNKHFINADFDKQAKYHVLLKLYNNNYYKTVKDIENAKFQ